MKCAVRFVNEPIKLVSVCIREELEIRRWAVVVESLVNKTGVKMSPFFNFWEFILDGKCEEMITHLRPETQGQSPV